jgi:hypothetical protein
LNKSTRLNNKLALKIQNFSTNIPHVDFLKKIYNVDCSGLNFEDIFLGRQR